MAETCGEMNDVQHEGPCWREKGHDGAHIADHGSNLIVAWPQDIDEKGRWA